MPLPPHPRRCRASNLARRDSDDWLRQPRSWEDALRGCRGVSVQRPKCPHRDSQAATPCAQRRGYPATAEESPRCAPKGPALGPIRRGPVRRWQGNCATLTCNDPKQPRRAPDSFWHADGLARFTPDAGTREEAKQVRWPIIPWQGPKWSENTYRGGKRVYGLAQLPEGWHSVEWHRVETTDTWRGL